jgi:hypothetical protein
MQTPPFRLKVNAKVKVILSNPETQISRPHLLLTVRMTFMFVTIPT